MIEYFTQIEAAFNETWGKTKFLRPSDWQLIKDWHHQGVPCEIVCQAIRECLSDDGNNAQSLGYCRKKVEQEFKLWQEKQKSGS